MATKKTYNVDPAFIKEAHKAACSDWKKKIEKKFPELFKPTAYDFGNEFPVSRDWNGPLTIGHGLAPKGLEGKCLVVDHTYEMEVKSHGRHQILIFKEKK